VEHGVGIVVDVAIIAIDLDRQQAIFSDIQCTLVGQLTEMLTILGIRCIHLPHILRFSVVYIYAAIDLPTIFSFDQHTF